MLQHPLDPRPLRIVGIDPGTDTLGAAALDVDLATRRVALLEVVTFSGSQMARAYPYISHVHGDRTARLRSHEENLYGYFHYLQPHNVICESPFLGRFPQAFAALTECVSYIRRAVWRYDPMMPLYLVDPPTVKLLVGVKGKGKTKEDVKQGLLRFQGLENPSNIDISSLDEHSVDAIVVALTRAMFILNNI